MVCFSLIPRPSPVFFCSSVCLQYNTLERKDGEKLGRPGLIHHTNDVRWTWGGHREEGPIIKYVRTKIEKQVSYLLKTSNFDHTKVRSPELQLNAWTDDPVCWFCDWTPPPYIHFASTSRPSDVIQVINEPRPSPFFTCSSTSVYYTERKPKNKNGGGLGMRLVCFRHVYAKCSLKWNIFWCLNS